MKQQFDKSYKKSFLPECELNTLQIRANLQSAHTCKIGKVFKERRLLLPLSESEVAAQTHININYIKAIESGDYSIFPARIFAVQYFRKYADFLGLRLNFFDIYNS
tara:strand:- start:98 stop:415 length:318 start_codon:yes stop_codon:yes gene_type:complete